MAWKFYLRMVDKIETRPLSLTFSSIHLIYITCAYDFTMLGPSLKWYRDVLTFHWYYRQPIVSHILWPIPSLNILVSFPLKCLSLSIFPCTAILFILPFNQEFHFLHPSYSSTSLIFHLMVGKDIYDTNSPPFASSIVGSFCSWISQPYTYHLLPFLPLEPGILLSYKLIIQIDL